MKAKTIILLLLTLILVSSVTYYIYQDRKCLSDCHKDPEMLRQANITEHGIDHVCYDSCVGGSTIRGLL